MNESVNLLRFLACLNAAGLGVVSVVVLLCILFTWKWVDKQYKPLLMAGGCLACMLISAGSVWANYIQIAKEPLAPSGLHQCGMALMGFVWTCVLIGFAARAGRPGEK